MPDLFAILLKRPVTTGIVFFTLTTSIYAMRNRNFFHRSILHPYGVVHRGEIIRLLSFGFVHNDAAHLLVNSVLLFLLCGELEEFLMGHFPLSPLVFGGMYLTSQLAGALTVTWVNRNNGSYPSAGASGSIIGCMMGLMILAPDLIAFYLPVAGGVQNIYAALILIIGMLVYQWRSGNEMLDNELHFFSALGGIAAAFFLRCALL